jgi:hypothetical protein
MKYLPRKKFLSSFVVVVLLFVQVLTLSPIAAFAAPPDPASLKDQYDATLSKQEIRSQLGLSEDVNVITDSELSELIRLCHVIGAYLVRQDDGTLALRLNNPNTVGVSQSFLNDYLTGLTEINALIKRGWVTIDDNFNMQAGPQLPISPAAINAGLAEIEDEVAGPAAVEDEAAGKDAEMALPAGENPEYYSRGFLFSFHSRRYSVPYSYASLGPTFASRFGVGRYGARFSFLFGFNRGFFHRTYRYGGYGYVPYYSRYRYGYNTFYYYPYNYYGGYYGRWYYRSLWY